MYIVAFYIFVRMTFSQYDYVNYMRPSSKMYLVK